MDKDAWKPGPGEPLLLDRRQLAELIGTTDNYLRSCHTWGSGPRETIVPAWPTVRFAREDVLAWLRAKRKRGLRDEADRVEREWPLAEGADDGRG